LRGVNPVASNQVAQDVNSITDLVIDALAELPSSDDNGIEEHVNIARFGRGVSTDGHQTIPCIPRGLNLPASPAQKKSPYEADTTSHGQYQGNPSYRMILAPLASASAFLPSNPRQDTARVSSSELPHLLATSNASGMETATKAPTSWAAVAAAKPEVNTGTSLGLVINHAKKGTETDPQASTPGPSTTPETLGEQQRVIWIAPASPSDFSLLDITEQIPGGALNSVCFSETADGEEGVCVVFMLASSANEFFNIHAYNCRKARPTYGPGVGLYFGKPMPASPSILAMFSREAGPARRRLTIARRQLFNEVTRDKFEYLVDGWVGEHNVELIFLYNSGNATIVLASVECAMHVKDKLEALGRRGGPYKGIVVSYSRDSTEAPLNLLSDIPARNPPRK
jgi:hypothetical protein